ncbi:aldo/keto reductase [Priestia megaterium]
MDYVKLGNTGLDVSRIALGCMSYGDPKRGRHTWTLNEEKSRPFFKKALDLGINFFDTANEYQMGSSEEIVGRALKDYANRDEVVIATKVYANMREGQNAFGLSRKAIMTEVDHSLRRLDTDYIDLYQIHRWDYNTPIEETMEALHDVVKAGKVRYIGASSMYTWQFQKANYTAERHGWTRFVSMQNHLNLLYREEEREMLPYCKEEKIGVIPWSPLARGRLTREWETTSVRSENDVFGDYLYKATAEADHKVVEAVKEVAENRGVPRAQIALAWVMQKQPVSAPIIGATKEHHLTDAVSALDIKLTPDEISKLEEPYIPHQVTGFY